MKKCSFFISGMLSSFIYQNIVYFVFVFLFSTTDVVITRNKYITFFEAEKLVSSGMLKSGDNKTCLPLTTNKSLNKVGLPDQN